MKRTQKHNQKISHALKGKPKSEEHKRKIAEAAKKRYAVPENNPNYRGDDVGYIGIHRWLIKTFGHAKKCKKCGLVGSRVNNKWTVHYAKKEGKDYQRKRENFTELCTKCHTEYDDIIKKGWITKKNNLIEI